MIRKCVSAAVVAVSLTVVACGGGSGIDQDEAAKIRDHAAEVQQDAQRKAEDVRNGTKDAGQVAKEIEADTNDLANETIDAAKDADLPDEVREQLEAAQQQLNGGTATDGK